MCEKEVLLGAWYGNVRSMSAICAAAGRPARRARQPNSPYAAAAAGAESGRQATGSHSMGIAWHGIGMACCTARVAQHLVFGSCQNTSFPAMCPSVRHLSTRPQPSAVQCHGMRCANDVSA